MKKKGLIPTDRYENAAALASCLLAIAVCFTLCAAGKNGHVLTLQMLMQCAIAAVAIITCYLLLHQPPEQRYKILLWAVICLGVIMRIGYMSYTPITLRQHDFGPISADGNRHAAYIYTLMQNRLPAENGGQFYHPPLFHALAAITTTCYQILSGETDFALSLEAAKSVSCCASILMLFYSVKLCRQIGLSQRGTLLAAVLAAFLPNNYLLAGRVNNDALVTFFFVAAMYYTLRWYHKRDWGSLCKLALCFGLGMMTKTSMATAALVTGCVMLVVLIKQLKLRKCGRLLGQYSVFAAIALPLGLWYPLRNRILFDQPINYVLRLSRNSDLYCGDASLWQRFGLGGDWLALYDRPLEDSNVWQYLWRGSLFGEFSFDAGKAIPGLLLAVNLLLIACSIVFLIYVLTRRPGVDWIVMAAFWMVQMGAYLLFNLQYPFGCTMDFRYVAPTALTGALFLAKGWESLSGTRFKTAARTVISVGAASFAVLSAVMFCNI